MKKNKTRAILIAFLIITNITSAFAFCYIKYGFNEEFNSIKTKILEMENKNENYKIDMAKKYSQIEEIQMLLTKLYNIEREFIYSDSDYLYSQFIEVYILEEDEDSVSAYVFDENKNMYCFYLDENGKPWTSIDYYNYEEYAEVIERDFKKLWENGVKIGNFIGPFYFDLSKRDARNALQKAFR